QTVLSRLSGSSHSSSSSTRCPAPVLSRDSAHTPAPPGIFPESVALPGPAPGAHIPGHFHRRSDLPDPDTRPDRWTVPEGSTAHPEGCTPEVSEPAVPAG